MSARAVNWKLIRRDGTAAAAGADVHYLARILVGFYSRMRRH